MIKQMHNQHKKDFEFRNIEKMEHLNKENQILLNRLLEIQAPQHAKSVARKHKKSELPTSQSERHLPIKRKAFRPKSLNLHARIINDQKIREENIKLAQRLFSKKAVLDFKGLKQEYVHHKKIKNNLKKVKPKGPKHKGRHNHLPPLAVHSKPISEVESTDHILDRHAQSNKNLESSHHRGLSKSVERTK